MSQARIIRSSIHVWQWYRICLFLWFSYRILKLFWVCGIFCFPWSYFQIHTNLTANRLIVKGMHLAVVSFRACSTGRWRKTTLDMRQGSSLFTNYKTNTVKFLTLKASLWPWSYSCWIYNYLCNHCLSHLTLRVRVPFMVRPYTRYNIKW